MAWVNPHSKEAYAAKKERSRAAKETTIPKPTGSETKAEIRAWLSLNGVDIEDPAISNLSKIELLGLVDDVSD